MSHTFIEIVELLESDRAHRGKVKTVSPAPQREVARSLRFARIRYFGLASSAETKLYKTRWGLVRRKSSFFATAALALWQNLRLGDSLDLLHFDNFLTVFVWATFRTAIFPSYAPCVSVKPAHQPRAACSFTT